MATARDSITYTFHNKRALLKNYNDTNVYKLQDPQIHIESGTPPTIRNLVVSYLELFNRNRRDLPQEIVLRFENSREATEDENAIASNHIGSTVLVYDFEKNNYINLLRERDQIMEFHEPIDLKDLVYTVSAVPDSSRSAYDDLSFRDSVLSDDTNLMAVPHKMNLYLDLGYEDWEEVAEVACRENYGLDYSIFPRMLEPEVTQQVPAQPAPRREPPPQRKPNSEDEPVDDDTKMFDASCTVCMIHKKQVFFRPCGHMATCFTCSERLTACPLCKVNIDSKDRVFY